MARQSAMDELSLKFGRYTLRRLIARGGMGEVYLAQLVGVAGFEKNCVIKKIRADLGSDELFIERFLNEGRTLVALTHSNIVQIFDMGEENGEYYLAMEYVQGADLRQILRSLKTGRVDVEIAVAVIREVLKGLSYAHRATDSRGEPLGIVHRDISSSNILISNEGEVKLIDFGIAKARTIESCSGLVQGKFAYMSPEQARGEHLDARTDLFSLGIVFYEMLTGCRPFEGNSDLQSLERIKIDTPRSVEEFTGICDGELERIVTRALAKPVEERYQSADEFYDDLMAYSSAHGFHTGQREVSQYFKSQVVEAPVRQTMDDALNAMLDAQAFACQTTATRTLSPRPVNGRNSVDGSVYGLSDTYEKVAVRTPSVRRRCEVAESGGEQDWEQGSVSDSSVRSERSSNSSNRRISPAIEKKVIEAESEDLAVLDESVLASLDDDVLRRRKRRRVWVRVRSGLIGGGIAILLLTGIVIVFWHINSRESVDNVRTALQEARAENMGLREGLEKGLKSEELERGESDWDVGQQVYQMSRRFQKGIPLVLDTEPDNATVYIIDGVYRLVDEKRMVLIPERNVEIAIQAPGYETCLFYVQFNQGTGTSAFRNVTWRNCQNVSSEFSPDSLLLEASVGLMPIRGNQLTAAVEKAEPEVVRKGADAGGRDAKVTKDKSIAGGNAERSVKDADKAVPRANAEDRAAASESLSAKSERGAKGTGKANDAVGNSETHEVSVSSNISAELVIEGERYSLPTTARMKKGVRYEIVPQVSGRQKGVPYRGSAGESDVSVQFCEANIRINESYVPGDPAPYQLSDIVLNGQQIGSKTDNLSVVLPCQSYTLDAYIREKGVTLSSHQKITVQSGKKNVYTLTLHVE